MMEGWGFYGLLSKAWNIDATVQFLNSRPNPVAIAILDNPWPNSFNPGADARVHINALFARCPGKIGALEVHVWWDKNHATNPHAICPLDVLQARCQLWEKWKTNHPAVTVYISHTLEYSETSVVEIQKRIACIKKYAPSCIPVNSPMGNRPVTPGDVGEKHTASARTSGKQIFNFDGSNCYDEDIQAIKNANSGLIFFLWCEEFNGSESGAFIPCNQRVNFPTLELLMQIAYEYDPPAARPVSPLGVGKLVKPELYKVCAEDEPKKDPRDLKPMLWLVGKSSNPVEIWTYDGKHMLGTLPHFNDTRYYAGLAGGINEWGYQIAQKAVQLTGSPFITFKADGGFKGLEDAGRRGDFFQ